MILSGRDSLSSKYTTALIIDSSNRGRYYPIKYVLGDFFLVEIEHQLYCFQMVSNREITFRGKGQRSYKLLIYSTDHIMPISAENNKELEVFLKTNALPKVDHMLLSTLKHLGNREKHDQKQFEKHDLKTLFDEVSQKEGEYEEYVKNLVTFFKNLNVNQIVLPVKKIAEFLQDDLITSNPQFWGSVITSLEITEGLHKKVTNQPKTAKTNWLIIIMIVALVGLGIGAIFFLYSSGAFNNLLPHLPNIGGSLGGPSASQPITANDLAAKYPTPESMITAIQAHTLDCHALAADVVKMVNNVKLGTCP